MSKKSKGKPHYRPAHTPVKASQPVPGAPTAGTPEAAIKPADKPVLHLLRVTIEAKSPLALGSGDISISTRKLCRDGDEGEETFVETALVRDAYGLPTIPGATLQGLLRGLADPGSPAFCRVFGWADGDEGQAAALSVGFARVHGVLDIAVGGFLATEQEAHDILADHILSKLRGERRLSRDHAKLNARHVVDGRAKFSRIAAPVGTRFSFEMALWSATGNADEDGKFLCGLVGLLSHPGLRVGGGGARGYGRIEVIKASYARPKMETVEELKKLRDRRARPPSEPFLHVFNMPAPNRGVVLATLELTPIGPWRIGGKGPPATEGTQGVRGADGLAMPGQGDARGGRAGAPRDPRDIATPAREPLIDWIAPRQWRDPKAETRFADNPFTIPGSAVRGPLVHRALFHWNRANGRLIDAEEWLRINETDRAEKLATFATRPEELAVLLGSPKERLAINARAARLLVDDGAVSGVGAIQGIDRNAIDRFTGGVRDGFLYAEEALVGGVIALHLVILPPDQTGSEWPEPVRAAFLAALADLCRGRLAIGANSLGFCHGRVHWGGDETRAAVWRAGWDAITAPAAGGAA